MLDEERIAAIEATIRAQETEGQRWTNLSIFEQVGGNYASLSQYLKTRRAEGAGVALAEVIPDEGPEAAPEAVPDAGPGEVHGSSMDAPADVPVSEVDRLRAELHRLEDSAAAWHAALEQIWALERDGDLTEADFGRRTWLEYQLVRVTKEQDRLRPQLRAAEVREAVQAAQQHHDAAVPQGQQLAQQALEAWRVASRLWQQLAAHFDRQVTPLVGLSGRDGPAFPTLGSGTEAAQAVFVALHANDPRALGTFGLLVRPQRANPQGALQGCPRLHPLNPRAITTVITTLTEGHTNGFHG